MTGDRLARIGVRVVELTYEADGVVSVRLAPIGSQPLPAWEPGAHVDLVLPVGIVRQYSIVDAAADRSWYRIAVLQEPTSRGGSDYVHLFLRPGQEVAIHPPLNHFALADAREYLFLAGGIGITPLLSMLDRVDARRRAWSLHYAGRSLATMAFRDRLAAHDRRVTLWPRDGGRMPLEDLLAARPGGLVYCCGPARLLDAVTEIAARHGWPVDALRLERFAPRARPQAANRPLAVRAARSGVDVTVGADESVLAALEHAGVGVASSCRDGVCGTCEVRVLEGRPDHRDDVLTPDQQQRGETMLVCVSRALTARLVLDV